MKRIVLSVALCVLSATPTSAQAPQGDSPPPAETPPAETSPAEASPPADGSQEGTPPVAPETGPATGPQSAPPEPAVDPKLEEAKRHFRQALAFAKTGDCRGAIAEFQAAYDLVPRPNALYNIAGCQERLFRYDLAIEFYERYLAEAPANAPDRAATDAALKTLRNLLGIVHVKSNVPAEVWIDDHLSGQAPGDVFVPAGGHMLELRADGYIPKRAEIKLVGRQEIDVDLTLEQAQTTIEVTETTGLDPTLFYAGLSGTVVTAVVGTIFAFRVQDLHADAEALPAVHPDRRQAKKDVQDAELIADIFFGATAVLAIGTTIVYFITDWDGAERPPADGAAAEQEITVRPVLGPSAAGISVGGSL